MDSVLPHQGKPVYALRETAYNMLQTKVAKATRTKYSGELNLMWKVTILMNVLATRYDRTPKLANSVKIFLLFESFEFGISEQAINLILNLLKQTSDVYIICD